MSIAHGDFFCPLNNPAIRTALENNPGPINNLESAIKRLGLLSGSICFATVFGGHAQSHSGWAGR